jgi:type II restriction enzyme
VREESAAALKGARTAQESDRTHTEVQSWLRDLGFALGFDVWIAANDRTRSCGQGQLSDGCLEQLPPAIGDLAGADAVRLIDVLWFHKGSHRIVAAFEVEHTTSIYSGIVRMLDLALSATGDAVRGLFLVAPDDREAEVRTQLARPLFQRVSDLEIRYLAYGELERHREAIARFGEGMKAINSIAKSLR